MRVLLPVVPLTDNYLRIFLPNPFLINRFLSYVFIPNSPTYATVIGGLKIAHPLIPIIHFISCGV